MLCEIIRKWCDAGAGVSLHSMGAVFHTSCVNYELSDLHNLHRIVPLWLLPDNVYLELRMLLRSPLFHEAAEVLLKYGRRMEGWDLECFYQHQFCQYDIQSEWEDFVSEREILFLFGDLNQQDEFVRHARRDRNLYLLKCEEWSPRRCMKKGVSPSNIYPLYICAPARKAVGLSPPAPVRCEMCQFDFLSTEPDGGGMRIPGHEFVQKKGLFGSYAHIYTCSRFPNMLIKGYRKNGGAACGSRLYKLRSLQSIGNNTEFGYLRIALPRHLLYDGSTCVAYSMDVCDGRRLMELLNDNDSRMNDNRALEHIFSSLFLLLLELHTKHIMVNDLSFNNIMIDKNNRVGIVDCDSFQVLWIPGGAITNYYRHPELNRAYDNDMLREPLHEHFALAVVLYQCIFRVNNPLIRCGGEEEPLWDQADFPLDTDGYARDHNGKEMCVNFDRFEYWMSRPWSIRQAFADVFHFRRILSIGAWIRTLGLNV